MQRNIVICSDGTGNTFDKSVSNVTRLIKLLALNDSKKQIVVYDQGIGTNARRLDAVKDYHQSIPDKNSLIALDGPKAWRFAPRLASLLGLAIGYGFKANVREMYKILSQLYEGPDDKIHLFGFSRGAFTVRALAGLIYHCGLPEKNMENLDDCFCEAYQLYYQLYKHRGKDLKHLEKIKEGSKRLEESKKIAELESKRNKETLRGSKRSRRSSTCAMSVRFTVRFIFLASGIRSNPTAAYGRNSYRTCATIRV